MRLEVNLKLNNLKSFKSAGEEDALSMIKKEMLMSCCQICKP